MALRLSTGYKYGDKISVKTQENNRGFTLLEVIIAVAIMGISMVLIMQLFSGGPGSGKHQAIIRLPLSMRRRWRDVNQA